ncbi:hypothetical protein [Streptomyces sp. NPDC058247]|uniref:hypothetical protein n=1 Tax=Streptomyces sp. NPDC058247 TaxID=3346401 RepID=UPI0036E839C9
MKHQRCGVGREHHERLPADREGAAERGRQGHRSDAGVKAAFGQDDRHGDLGEWQIQAACDAGAGEAECRAALGAGSAPAPSNSASMTWARTTHTAEDGMPSRTLTAVPCGKEFHNCR